MLDMLGTRGAFAAPPTSYSDSLPSLPNPHSKESQEAALRTKIERQKELIQSLDDQLNQQNKRAAIEDEMFEVQAQMAGQQARAQDLRQAYNAETQQIFQSFEQQNRQVQSQLQAQENELNRLRDLYNKQENLLQYEGVEVEHIARRNIDTDTFLAWRQQYFQDLEAHRQLQSQIQALDLKQREDTALAQTQRLWQINAAQQELNQEVGDQYKQANAQYMNLQKKYDALQKEAEQLQNKEESLNQEFARQNRIYDDLVAQYDQLQATG
jgi:chromosome segregation ATPase